MAQCLNDGIEIRLARAAADRCNRRVCDVHPGVRGFQNRARVDAARIVRVEVNGNANFFTQRLHQFECGIRLAKTRHILNGQKVRTKFLELLRQRDVILQRILRAPFVENVPCITNRRFAHRARFQRRVNGHAHVVNGIERIEDAEDVDPLRMRFADEFDNDVIGVGGVADRVRSAQQHLEADVGNGLAEHAEAMPRIFMQESHRRVERGASPHFQAEEAWQSLRHRVGRCEQIVRAYPRRHQRLVRIAKSSVGDQQTLLFSRPVCKLLRPQLFQELPRPVRRRDARRRRSNCSFQLFGDLLSFHFRVAIQDHVAKVGKQFARAVGGAGQTEKFR